ncbi:hypothetical protein REPUB_Repub07fG0194600 [Reevesia pubescens]
MQKSFEDLDLEKQVKILNKPFVKSIKTDEGDIFDCVEIYEQPAFDHPLLKNHKIQMEPTSPKGLKSANSLPAKSVEIGGCCPSGTVPIKRTSKEDLIRAKMFMKSIQPTTAASPGYHNALRLLQTGENFTGAGAMFNTQNPSVSSTQFSEAFVRVQSGSQNQIDNIQIGWMVNPALQGDNYTRIFASWSAQKKGCYNLLCPGFVQVNQAIPLGVILHNVSVYGGQQFDFGYFISRDQDTGHWWLFLGEDYDQKIGYWPDSLFTSLSNSATQITWGGGAFSSNNEGNPPMGSGHFPEEGMNKAAYIRDIQIEEYGHSGYPMPTVLQYIADDPKCYNIGPMAGDVNGFFYGGPGGPC